MSTIYILYTCELSSYTQHISCDKVANPFSNCKPSTQRTISSLRKSGKMLHNFGEPEERRKSLGSIWSNTVLRVQCTLLQNVKIVTKFCCRLISNCSAVVAGGPCIWLEVYCCHWHIQARHLVQLLFYRVQVLINYAELLSCKGISSPDFTQHFVCVWCWPFWTRQ